MSKKEFAFTDAQGSQTNLEELDVMLYNKKQHTICFARDKEHLVFSITPSRETHRHVNFIRDKLNFKTFGKIVGKIFNLSGEAEFEKDYYLWRFQKSDAEKKEIGIGYLIVFDYEESILSIRKLGSSGDIISAKVALIQSETDLFEVASFISAFFNCVAREYDSSKKKIVYRMIPF